MRSLIVASFFLLLPAVAQADKGRSLVDAHPNYPRTWNLPQELSPDTAEINFEVDSTFHLVEGKTSDIAGKIWLNDPADPLSLRFRLALPVAAFRTENKSRDKKIREIMAEKTFPLVQVESFAVQTSCSPLTAEQHFGCDGKLKAKLTIRDVTNDVDLPFNVKLQGDRYAINGKFSFQWPDYHVEDPSSLFTRVDKTVLVRYQLNVPMKTQDVRPQGSRK